MDKTQVLEAYRRHSGDQYAVARELSLTPMKVTDAIRSLEHRPSEGVQFVVSVKKRPEGLGRPVIRHRIISIRHRDDAGWPIEDRRAIELARDAYDRGEIELAQGREGPWIIQYLFPRRRKHNKREPWLTAFKRFVI